MLLGEVKTIVPTFPNQQNKQSLPLAAFPIPYYQCLGESTECVASCIAPEASTDDIESCTNYCYDRFQCGTKMGVQTLQVDAQGQRVDGTGKKRTSDVKSMAMIRDSSAASKASVTAASIFVSAIVALLV